MEYEIKIWKRGYHDYAWAVREADARFSFADGVGATSKKEAEELAWSAVAVYEARTKAKWKPLSYAI